MKKKYFLIACLSLITSSITSAQEAKFFIDFEVANALTNLPSDVTNINSTNTVTVKSTTTYTPINNSVGVNPNDSNDNELFLDYHGYLKMDLDVSNGYSIALDYRRSPEDADWYLGFLTQIGNNNGSNSIERIKLMRYWEGSLEFNGTESSWQGVSMDNDTHIVITVSGSGDVKIYQNSTEILSVDNATSNKNLTSWTDASLLLSFNGGSYDGTTVTPEPDYASNSRDTRAFVDNIALFERELSTSEVSQLYNNGNNSLGVLSVADNKAFKNEIKLFPNPINSSINEISFSSVEVKSVEIYNILGAKVLSGDVIKSKLNVNSLSTGTYLIKTFDKNRRNLSNNKLIKI